MMLLAAFIVLTLCFVFVLALLCVAPEAHEVEGRGFHLGAIENCPLCVDRPLAHCPECNLWLREHEGCEHIPPAPLTAGLLERVADNSAAARSLCDSSSHAARSK